MKICIYDIHHRAAGVFEISPSKKQAAKKFTLVHGEPEILAILTEERERRILVRAQKAKVSKVP